MNSRPTGDTMPASSLKEMLHHSVCNYKTLDRGRIAPPLQQAL